MTTATTKKRTAAETPPATGAAIVRYADLHAIVGLSRAQISRLVRAGKFPLPVPLGPNSVGFLRSEIDAWLAERASPEYREHELNRRLEALELRRKAPQGKRKEPRGTPA